jgi:hypothetical protein
MSKLSETYQQWVGQQRGEVKEVTLISFDVTEVTDEAGRDAEPYLPTTGCLVVNVLEIGDQTIPINGMYVNYGNHDFEMTVEGIEDRGNQCFITVRSKLTNETMKLTIDPGSFVS